MKEEDQTLVREAENVTSELALDGDPPPEEQEAGFKYTAEFEVWWAAYPRRIGKLAACRAYTAAKKLIGADAQYEQTVAQVVALMEQPRLGLALPLDIQGTAFQQRVWQALQGRASLP